MTTVSQLWLTCLIGLALSLSTGCKKDGADEADDPAADQGPSFDDVGDEMAYERCKEELPQIKEQLEKGELPGATCAGMLSYAERIAGHDHADVQAISKQMVEVCGLDSPLAEVQKEVDEAKSKREGDEGAIIAGDCSMARSRLDTVHETFSNHERVKAMAATITGVCGE